MVMNDYEYEPLSTQTPSFRLLRLRRGGDTTRIECELFHAVISDHHAVTYEALSYAWGSTELVDTVEVNGRRLWITENLYSALQCLRLRDQDRVLWIDAVCIDQSNKQEQSRQVLEMRNIFGFATRVIFWLGKPTADIILLMSSLRELQSKVAILLQAGIKVDNTILKALWLGVQHTQDDQGPDWLLQRRRGLRVLLKRQWFERIWILQEVRNARAAIVCSGISSVPADVFAFSPFLLDLNVDSHVQSVLNMMPGRIKSGHWDNLQRHSLIDLYNKFHASKATDQRDKIFALLDISSDPSEHELLRPDYTKPMQEVLHDTIRYWFEYTVATISTVLHTLTKFEAIHVTYIVPPTEVATRTEEVQVPNQPTTVLCVRDASLFLLEHLPIEASEQRDTVYMELERLQSKMLIDEGDKQALFVEKWLSRSDNKKLKSIRKYADSFRLISWQSTQQHVRLLVLKDIVGSLVSASFYGYTRALFFIADRSNKHKPELLGEALTEAVQNRCWDSVLLLLEQGANVNANGGYNATAFQRALHDGYVEVAEILLEKGANLYTRGNWRYTGLVHMALKTGRRKLVQLLLERRLDSSTQRDHDGIPQEWSYQGFRKIVELLLEASDVNTQGGEIDHALQAMSYREFLEIVQLMLEKGAHINAGRNLCDGVLRLAREKQREQTVKVLLTSDMQGP